ncbi:MAG: 3-dehydroquinate dehydratase [Melioribacteraceae bacterium]|nr:3-dehydroquinate dehydratase [Melioribacteraceae bacterium]MDD3559145.1 3-dehydroquinate dehydratase [Melioribacteraceae bacterium]
MKIKIINGPNLNLLEERDNKQYGNLSLQEINQHIINSFPDVEFEFFQTNLEGEIVEHVQGARGFDGLIINPAGYTHTSVAIRDALETLTIPKIEVHLSNLTAREDFRKNQITTAKCDGYISGFKHFGYIAAVFLLKTILNKN